MECTHKGLYDDTSDLSALRIWAGCSIWVVTQFRSVLKGQGFSRAASLSLF
jgi:hypothetical protein